MKIDNLFTDCLEMTLHAKYAARENKLGKITQLSIAFDSLKFFLQLLWEAHALEDKQYLALSQHLVEIGKMIGGWMNSLKKGTPPRQYVGEEHR